MEKEINGIAIRECADLGPVIARADHHDRAIEVNRRIFYGLPPMVQEFVLCHEVCHLQYNEHDEAVTKQIAAQLFLSRASSEVDRQSRTEFLAYAEGEDGKYSNELATIIIAAVTAAFSISMTIADLVKTRNAGWYSWDLKTQEANVRSMLTQAFEQSRRSSLSSAKDFFWENLKQYDNKDKNFEKFINRDGNAWVGNYIAAFEKKYGFGFYEVTPVDWTAYTGVKVALGAIAALAAFMIIKKIL